MRSLSNWTRRSSGYLCLCGEHPAPRCTDQLRSRGEHSCGISEYAVSFGSPLLARRGQVLHLDRLDDHRFTSTRAETAGRLLRCRTDHTVRVRLYGDHYAEVYNPPVGGGSTPLARSSHGFTTLIRQTRGSPLLVQRPPDDGDWEDVHAGFISAGVEPTRWCRRSARRPVGHLRSCGEGVEFVNAMGERAVQFRSCGARRIPTVAGPSTR